MRVLTRPEEVDSSETTLIVTQSGFSKTKSINTIIWYEVLNQNSSRWRRSDVQESQLWFEEMMRSVRDPWSGLWTVRDLALRFLDTSCGDASRNEATSVSEPPSSSALYLQACIGGYWASSPVCTCPLCKRQFEERPQLSVNKVFALIADKYKMARYGAAGLPTPAVRTRTASQTDAMMTNTNPFVTPSAEEVVWCDVCTGVKQPAVSSCLTCTASYCTEHVQPHRTTPFYSKHPLMDPQEALKGRTCSIHHRLLEVRGSTSQNTRSKFNTIQD